MKVFLVYCRYPETYSYSGWTHELQQICATKEIAESYIKKKGYIPGVEKRDEFTTYMIEEESVLSD